MLTANPTGCKVLVFPLPEQSATSQAKHWIDGIIESNDNLRVALELLRDSYCAILAGSAVDNAQEVLAQVEAILQVAERAQQATF